MYKTELGNKLKFYELFVKAQYKLVLAYVTRTCGGGGVTDPLIFNLSTRLNGI